MKLNTAQILKKVREIEIKTGKLVSESFSGQYLSVFKGKGIEFAEVREYTVGDDIRTIDWNITARTNKVYVKKFNEERELTIIIATDISSSLFFGTKRKLKNELAAELAALFMFAALKNNDKLGLYLFSDKTELYIPPKKGKNHVLRIIREIIAYQPKSPYTNISNALKKINQIVKRRCVIILISDFQDEGFEKDIKITQQRHDLIPVIINDPLEIELKNYPAFISYFDEEKQKWGIIDLSDRYIINSYNSYQNQKQENLKKLFRSSNIDFMEITTESDIFKTVTKFFKNRRIRTSV
ncbi:MAG: DUF58 domain-containing protein [Elusimicrobiales bacterium]|nr:DUF58 domain-containing protein [Elusimicrobiales bacterium]